MPTDPPHRHPDPRVLDAVRSTFGFDTLRPLQAESIAATLNGRDSLTVMPTGGGKSLCYQVPPLVTGKLTLVASPLIALMRDQVAAMNLAGVPAAALHSHLDASEARDVWRQVDDGTLRLLLVAPERLLTREFLSRMAAADLGAIAIDEAHCISQWGHDFRPEYRRLSDLRQIFADVPMGAFTATATPRVRQDIIDQLHLRDPRVLVGSFDRPNLTYRVLPKVDLPDQVAQALLRHRDEAAIVYCISRKDTETLAGSLKARGIDAAAYHAGLDPSVRTRVSERFRLERLDVVVATVAFGMGIDRGDVRCVIHAAMPKSVEHYQQETGRAGRDGLPSECLLLYSSQDVVRWKNLMQRGADESDDPQAAAESLATQYALLDQVQRLVGSARCRHRALTEYFGQEYPHETCGACDVCLKELDEFPDAHDTARKIISCVARCALAGQSFGAAHIADVLLGSKAAKVRERGHDRLSTFGLLAGLGKPRVQSFINQLVDAGDLGRTAGEYPTLYLTEQSTAVLKNQKQATLVEPRDVPAPRPSRQRAGPAAPVEPLAEGEQPLFEALRLVRRRIADARNVPPFVVMDDNSLREICQVRPGSLDTLITIRGIGPKKVEDFGLEIVQAVRDEAQRLGLALDARPGSRPRRMPLDADAPEPSERSPLRQPPPRSPTPGRVFEQDSGSGNSADDGDATPRLSYGAATAAPLFRRGDTIEQVAAALGRARSTVENYLAEFIAIERPRDLSVWVDAPCEQRILDAARQAGEGRLKPIYDALNAEVPYWQIRATLAFHFPPDHDS